MNKERMALGGWFDNNDYFKQTFDFLFEQGRKAGKEKICAAKDCGGEGEIGLEDETWLCLEHDWKFNSN